MCLNLVRVESYRQSQDFKLRHYQRFRFTGLRMRCCFLPCLRAAHVYGQPTDPDRTDGGLRSGPLATRTGPGGGVADVRPTRDRPAHAHVPVDLLPVSPTKGRRWRVGHRNVVQGTGRAGRATPTGAAMAFRAGISGKPRTPGMPSMDKREGDYLGSLRVGVAFVRLFSYIRRWSGNDGESRLTTAG